MPCDQIIMSFRDILRVFFLISLGKFMGICVSNRMFLPKLEEKKKVSVATKVACLHSQSLIYFHLFCGNGYVLVELFKSLFSWYFLGIHSVLVRT